MQRALELAEQGRGYTATNPLVGAVIIKNEKIIGEGYHHFYGGDHAEVDAIKNATADLRGATMFVTLEPCSHQGKTPPCAQALIEAGITRVFVAMQDPNPKVAGQGLALLREAGVEVEVGLCEAEARRLNEPYLKYIETGLPFVTVKIAQTLDGKIADFRGDSKWITGEAARRRVHKLRAASDAVMVGAGTARADDPSLTTHGVRDRDPLRLILCGTRELSGELKLLANNQDDRTILISSNGVPKNTAVQGWCIESEATGRLNLKEVLKHAAQEKVCSILVEGGQRVFSELILAGLVDKYIFVTAPKLVGSGLAGFTAAAELPLSESLQLRIDRVERIDDDIWIEAYPEK
jgi:diaminohydroxyphosphoribosylaminopyrimidine deaminase/5-amino-6-(5-phosphoribosylamino)uracil reductase